MPMAKPADVKVGGLRRRRPDGIAGVIVETLLVATPVIGLMFIFNLHTTLNIRLFEEQWIGLFAGIMLALSFLVLPATANSPLDRVPWYDWVGAVLAISTGVYITAYYPSISALLGWVSWDRVLFGTISILATLEAVRRSTGLILVVVIVVFLAYGLLAPYMPGALRGDATGTADYINYLYLDGNNGLGILRIAATIALAFLLFGQVLAKFGGSEAINDLAFALFGTRRGGPAKAAIMGSSLVGTMTGGAAINVMVTGVISIPLMIRTGYRPVVAGAVEAVASTGGGIMPPVMGIAAFMIAETLAIPYGEVVIAALIPALLYYLGIFAQVDLAAARLGLKGLPKSELPSLSSAIRKGWVVILPIAALFYLLGILGHEPSFAGGLVAIFAVPLFLIHRENRSGLISRLWETLSDTSFNLITITVVLGGAGLIVGVTNITGLGFNMALSLSQVGEFGSFPLLVASAIVCIILGMGMPSVAAYALVAILVAPALENLGIHPLAAHLFIFYFASISSFTPPIALACFAAASICGGNAHHIGIHSVRLGIAAILAPFVFVYAPTLIMIGEPLAIFVTTVTAALGIIFLSIAIEGYATRPLGWVARAAATVSSALLLYPIHGDGGAQWLVNAAGGVIAIAVLAITHRGTYSPFGIPKKEPVNERP